MATIGSFLYAVCAYHYNRLALGTVWVEGAHYAAAVWNEDRAQAILQESGLSSHVRKAVSHLFGLPSCLPLDLSKAEILVHAKNKLADALQARLEQIKNVALEVVGKMAERYPYINGSLTLKQAEDMSVGMTQHFLIAYTQKRGEGSCFEEAAKAAARSFEEGATTEAYIFQLIHDSDPIDADKWKISFGDNWHSMAMAQVMKSVLGYRTGLGGENQTQVRAHITQMLEPNQLENGSYQVFLGFQSGQIAEQAWFVARATQHTVALLVENDSCLIFDPSYGLLKYECPEDYFTDNQTVCGSHFSYVQLISVEEGESRYPDYVRS